MAKYELKIRDTPPSMNASAGGGSRSNHFAQARMKLKWEGLCFVGLLEAKVPKGLERVSATAVVITKDRRARDVGNYRYMLEKALGDTLVKGGWLTDDSFDYYVFPHLQFELDKPRWPLTLVTLDCEPVREPVPKAA